MSNFLSFYNDKCNGFSCYQVNKSEIIFTFTGLQLIMRGINYFYCSHKNNLPLDQMIIDEYAFENILLVSLILKYIMEKEKS